MQQLISKNRFALALMLFGALICLFSPAWVRYTRSRSFPDMRSIEPCREIGSSFQFANCYTSSLVTLEPGFEDHPLTTTLGFRRLSSIPWNERETSITSRIGFPFLSGRDIYISIRNSEQRSAGTSCSVPPPLRTIEFRTWSVPLSIANFLAGAFLGYGCALPFILARRAILKLRQRRGLCRCGYLVLDLPRCPECGEETHNFFEPLRASEPWHTKLRLPLASCTIAALVCTLSPFILRTLASKPGIFNLEDSLDPPTQTELNCPLWLRGNVESFRENSYVHSWFDPDSLCPPHINLATVNAVDQTRCGFPLRNATFSRIAYEQPTLLSEKSQLWHDTVRFNFASTAVNAVTGIYFGYLAFHFLGIILKRP